MPEEFGRYRLVELIGRGGMGEVYRAVDTVRERTVALKVLPDYLAGDESFETRFRRESQMAARLNEPHIIPIHDFGEIDGRLFIDMRLVEGHDLGSVISTRNRLPVDIAVDIVAQVAAALDAAHASGLVHRDVKPSNILLTGLGDDPDAMPFAYLVDFGIARSAAQEGTSLTATTTTVGTVAYMSPERISGQPSDLRTDVYALACVLFEMLAGRKPYEGETFAQMYAHINSPVPRAGAVRGDVPPALDDVIARGMAKNPDERYRSAGALAAAARAAARAPRSSAGTPRVGPGGPFGSDARLPQVRGAGTPPPYPGPVRPAPEGAAVRPPLEGGSIRPEQRQWTPPPVSRPPGQGSQPGPGGPSGPAGPSGPRGLSGVGGPAASARPSRSRRPAILAAVVVVVLAIAALTAFIATRGSDDTASPGPSPSPSVSGSTSESDSASNSGSESASPTLSTGGPSTPTVDWAHFASFSQLVGTKNGDTDHAFEQSSCSLTSANTHDAAQGIQDEVQCALPNSTESITVARFDTAARLQTYLFADLNTLSYRELIWTTGSRPRGLTIISPRSGAGPGIITSTICGLPTYLVQIASPDRNKIDTRQLYDDVWNKANFPDVTPPNCNSSFTGPTAGVAPQASIGATKLAQTMDSASIRTLLQRGDPTAQIVQVRTAKGIDAIVAGQQGRVSFWSEVDDTLQKGNGSTYPYAPSSLGAPDVTATGTVLSGMTHATFVVRGTFSGDSSGNAVAYTRGTKGWGAIKAVSGGDLVPSGQGVGIGGIGLSDDFGLVNGRLKTVDCSSTLPISRCSGNNRVIKYWTWKQTRFVQTGHAGRTS